MHRKVTKVELNPVTKRLLEFIEYLERSDTADGITKKLKVSPSAISQLKKERANAGNRLIEKFIIIYNLNRDWLFTGEGEMRLNQEKFNNSINFREQQSESIREILSINKQYQILINREHELLFKEIDQIKEDLGKVKLIVFKPEDK